jgi:hypothetical protein
LHASRDLHLLTNPKNAERRYVVAKWYCGEFPEQMTYKLPAVVKAEDDISTTYYFVSTEGKVSVRGSLDVHYEQ